MSNGPAIVIEGTRVRTGPVAPRTLTPLDPAREPNRQTFWFGAELAPGTATMCGSGSPWRPSTGCRRRRLVPVATAWSTRSLPGSATTETTSWRISTASRSNVSNAGDTRTEPYGDGD